ncbi:MAG: isopentenyl phosphate kinase [Thermoflexales bacterium]
MDSIVLLKLGGSLITDKTRPQTARPEVIARIAREIRAALAARPQSLIIGHGSGSFGHTVAQQHGTRHGVRTPEQWRGFAEVSVIAARLNRLVADALHEAGLPVISFPPSASARCVGGRMVELALSPLRRALDHGLIPLLMGDVAFDEQRGGVIISTEEVFAYLAEHLPVRDVLLAGETEGVYRNFATGDHRMIPRITPALWEQIQHGVGNSHGMDVTGGMAGKVRDMLSLVQRHPTLRAYIFSGLVPGNVQQALLGLPIGTEICASDDALHVSGKPTLA